MLISLLAHQSFPMELSELRAEVLSRQAGVPPLIKVREREREPEAGHFLQRAGESVYEGGVGEVEHTAASSLSSCIRPHLYVSNSWRQDEQELKSTRRVFW